MDKRKLFLVICVIFTKDREIRAEGYIDLPDFESILENSGIIKIKDNIKKYVENYGVSGLEKKMKDGLERYKTQKVSLAVTGQTGAGKSSLINTMRGLKASDSGAAKVGVTETTKTLQRYYHPNLLNYLIYDLPGVNSPNFPHSTYVENVHLLSYDCIIICTQKRFTDNDLWLAKLAADNKIPYVLVRTHVDLDIQNAARDDGDKFDEQATLGKMRNEISNHLAYNNLPINAIFLISTILTDTGKWHYPQMMKHVLEKLPQETEEAFIMSLVASSKETIQIISDQLKERIPSVAFHAALSQGWSRAGESYLEDERNLYRQKLGLIEEQVESFHFQEAAVGYTMHGAAAAALAYFGPWSAVTVVTIGGSRTVYSILANTIPYEQSLAHDLVEIKNKALSRITIPTDQKMKRHTEL